MPEEITVMNEAPQPIEPKQTDWPKVILVTVLGFGFLTSVAYASYWYGAKQAQRVEEPIVVSEPTPTSKPTPTPTSVVEDKTKGWKIHRNDKYDYTMKYPSDFYVAGSSDSQSASFGPIQYREVIKSHHAVMGIDSALTTLSPQQFLDKYGNTHTFSNPREIKNMTIDGSQAIQFTSTNKQTGIVATHTLVNAKNESGELLIISKYHVSKDKGEVSDETYNLILSTLKFLD